MYYTYETQHLRIYAMLIFLTLLSRPLLYDKILEVINIQVRVFNITTNYDLKQML